MLRAIRGAIQIDRDQPELVHEATRKLFRTLMEWNGLAADQLVSLFFTMTPDLRSAFPAAAVREAGVGDVPMMCATEVAVPGALPRVIRLMAHVETALDRAEIRHPYLTGAAQLRPDLVAEAR
ncbi:chorismate mutase [Actinoplanes regularis]|nr:chorismate mutase [Actinoplanes regularis]